MFFGGQTVTLGNFISAMGKVSTVVLTGLSDQDLKDALMIKLAPTKPVMTQRIQNSLAFLLVVEI